MKAIGIVTVGRADYSILKPVIAAIRDHGDLELKLIATGAHLSDAHGRTIEDIKHDGFDIDANVDMEIGDDRPLGISHSLAMGIRGFGDLFAKMDIDILVLIGDRFETFAAACAAMPFNLPIAHIHGGELTEGAIDDAIRHAITKMAHLHFVAAEPFARRVRQLGEEDWRITVCGAPALDNLRSIEVMSLEQLAEDLGTPLEAPVAVVTFHPETIAPKSSVKHFHEVLNALSDWPGTVVLTYPNADTGNRTLAKMLEEFCASHASAHGVVSLGTVRYYSLLQGAAVMVGNSSSGIIEAASFALPVVNVGNRQGGRLRSDNVIDVAAEEGVIRAALDQAMSDAFRKRILGLQNPYGDGGAAARIVDVLSRAPAREVLIEKQFVHGQP